MVTFEEASRCPKCDNPGELTETRPGQRGTQIHIIYCRNKVCRWYDTNWIVQQNPDGTIPVRDMTVEKTFPRMDSTPEAAKRYLDSIKDTDPPRR